MKLIMTETQKSDRDIPTRLELLQELNKRGALMHNKELQDELNRQTRGFEGEQTLLEMIDDVGREHWIVLRNVWLKYFGKFECDLMLITHAGVYLFEVKNYSGRFEIDQHIGKHGKKTVRNNVVSQANSMVNGFREILHKSIRNLNVVGIAAFVGKNNQVIIKDKISGLHILGPNEIHAFIWKIRQEEYQHAGYPIDSEEILQAIAPYDISPPYPPEEDISLETFQHARGGVCCSRCGNFELDTTKKYLVCSCGMIEPRDEMIIRTICEYGVLNYQRNLKTTDLVAFFNGDVKRTNILRLLNQHFEKIGNIRNAAYLNKGRPLVGVYNDFYLPEEKYIRFSGPTI